MTSDLAYRVVSEARKCLNVKYVDQGRSPEQGFDCVGLPFYVGNACGQVPVGYVFPVYGRGSNHINLMKVCEDLMVRIIPVSISNVRLADILILGFGQLPTHMGIVADHPSGGFTLIHAYEYAVPPRVVEHYLDGSWFGRVKRIYRIKSLVE